MIHHLYEQGSEEWLSVRRGLITGSMFKVARERLKNGKPSKACEQYAMDLAIERCGGVTAEKFQSFHMRQGAEQEPVARAAYEAATGNSVNVVGFFSDDVGFFGCSPDGLIGEDGVLEIKTAVSSATFFRAAVDEDLSEYMDQCLGYLWMLGREWVDLCIWRPDFPHLHIKRIQRSEVTKDIDSLERDMLEFAQIVAGYEAKLKGVLSG